MNYNSVVIRVYSLEVSVLLIDVPLSEGALRGTVFHMSSSPVFNSGVGNITFNVE